MTSYSYRTIGDDDCIPSPLARISSALWLQGRALAPCPLAFGPLPVDPLANVCGAVFQGGASRFALSEEGQSVAIDELDLLQVEREGALATFALDQPSELREMLGLDT